MSNPEHLYNQAAKAATQGNFELALVFLGELLSKYPNIAKAHFLSATSMMRLGKFLQASQHAHASVQFEPSHGPSRWVYGICLAEMGRHEEAIPQFRAACELSPKEAMGWNNLAQALLQTQRFHEAEEAFRTGLQLTGKIPQLSVGLAWSLLHTGRADEALAALQAQNQHTPGDHGLQYATALMSLYSSNVDAQALNEAHRNYGRTLAAHFSGPSRPADPTPADADRALRVALLTPDLYGHSVSRFIEPLLAHANRDRVRFGIFATGWKRDEITGHLEKLAGLWNETFRLSDQLAVAEIRRCQVDIIIDLAGHMPMNRAFLLPQRPAPITMTYLGYPHSTGYEGVDYRIVDSITDPPGQSEPFCTETLLRLDPCFLCFMPAVVPPEIEPLDPNFSSPIVFGSFNNAAKYSPKTFELWARVVRAVPDSKLLLKSYSLPDPGARAHVLKSLESHGVDPSRVELLGLIPNTHEHLKKYSRIHISLDTFPYHGTTTTCESLLMGVPVVTLVGNEHRSRVGASLLNAVGLNELAATTPDDYIRIAQTLAQDRKRIANYRSTLRTQILSSPLMDGPGFAARFEKLLRDIWRKKCSENA